MHMVIYNWGSFKQIKLRGCLKFMYDLRKPPIWRFPLCYAHSKAHEKEEFLAYDLPLNRAIEEFSPHSAKILRGEAGKRWLSFDFL